MVEEKVNTEVKEQQIEEPRISMKPVNFQLNEVVFLKGIRFKISYFNQGKKRMTLEPYPYNEKEIGELKKTLQEEKK